MAREESQTRKQTTWATEQEQETISQIRSAAEAIAKESIEDLVQRDRLGQAMDFSAARQLFEKVKFLAAILLEHDLDGASVGYLNSIRTTVANVGNRLGQIKSFNPSQAPQQREQHISQLQALATELYQQIATTIPMQAVLHQKVSTELEQSRESLKQMQAMLTDADSTKGKVESALSAIQAQAESTLSSIQAAAGKAGVAAHAKLFEEEANRHRAAAIWWLGAACAIAVIAAAYAICMALYPNLLNPASTPPVVESSTTAIPSTLALSAQLVHFFPRLIIFSLLFLALGWAGRNYRAHRHNNVMNRHRQNALGTFEAFVDAAEDEDTRNAVLLRATESIFAAGTSGYLGKESEAQGSPQILEIMRGAMRRSPEG